MAERAPDSDGAGRHGAEAAARRRGLAVRLARALASLLVAALALVGFLAVTRGTPVDHVGARALDASPPATAPEFARTVGLFTGAALSSGNRVEVLTNGAETFPRLWADLRSARRSVAVQMYYAKPGAVADTLAAILAAKAREGVPTLLLLDDFGSSSLSPSWDDSLRRAGVRVARLRKLRWYKLNRFTSRSHVRAVVVDGAVGYTGGFGLADYWLGDGHASGEWRDTNVRFSGPAVAQLQAAFAAAWAEPTGELLAGDTFFPGAARVASAYTPPAGVRAALAYTAPPKGSTPAARLLALSIAGARRTLYVSNAYFVPDDDFRRFLVAAVSRGVDVRVLTAGPRTDVKSVYWASRARYEPLLRGGVRIYEYQPTMMHAKTLVADGIWSAVGSMNFDNRSLALNDEANLVMYDVHVGAALDSIFRDDLRYAREITLAQFRRRPWWQRPLESVMTLLSRVL